MRLQSKGDDIYGKKDTITKDYMNDNAVFADVFNYLTKVSKNSPSSTGGR